MHATWASCLPLYLPNRLALTWHPKLSIIAAYITQFHFTMAISSSKKSLISLPLLAFITTYLVLLHTVNSQDSLSFTFGEFDADDENLIFQGDASVSSSKALQLTKVDDNGNPLGGSVGRVLYSTPFRVWDNSGGRLAILDSSFIIRISSRGANPIADGLAFFVVSANSTIPPGSGGALLGLFSNANALNNSRNEIVGFKASSDRVFAIEFDTYPNRNIGDPNYKHIGINVNSIRSKDFRRWDWQDGQLVAAHIQYNAAARVLRVFASYPDGSRVDFTNNDIDLATVLPEWVRVGFSASTGQYAQENNVVSWAFGAYYRSNNVQEKDGYIASVV